jgi:hypothetical protein
MHFAKTTVITELDDFFFLTTSPGAKCLSVYGPQVFLF